MRYVALGWIKHAEEDVFESGCLPESAIGDGNNSPITANTIEELIKKCSSHVGNFDMKNVLIDNCGEQGRLDVQVYEDGEGLVATHYETQQWKAGKQRLWLATYTFMIMRMEAVELRANVANPQHIPGEWKVGNTHAANGEWVTSILADGKCIALILGDEVKSGFADTSEHAEANARLIAAAPKLLEALEGIAQGNRMQAPFTYAETVLAYQEIARKAIAAAKGE